MVVKRDMIVFSKWSIHWMNPQHWRVSRWVGWTRYYNVFVCNLWRISVHIRVKGMTT